MNLTQKQFDTLMFIRDHIARQGYAPTVGEMAAHFNVAPTTIAHRLELLENMGYVGKTPRMHRSRYIRRLPSYRSI